MYACLSRLSINQQLVSPNKQKILQKTAKQAVFYSTNVQKPASIEGAEKKPIGYLPYSCL
jgi:hypothetical protein